MRLPYQVHRLADDQLLLVWRTPRRVDVITGHRPGGEKVRFEIQLDGTAVSVESLSEIESDAILSTSALCGFRTVCFSAERTSRGIKGALGIMVHQSDLRPRHMPKEEWLEQDESRPTVIPIYRLERLTPDFVYLNDFVSEAAHMAEEVLSGTYAREESIVINALLDSI